MPASKRGAFATRGVPLRSKMRPREGAMGEYAQTVVLGALLVGVAFEDLHAHEL